MSATDTSKSVREEVVRSVIRHGFPDTNRNRALAVFTNFFLHMHPVKARLKAIAFRRTYYLGGLSAAMFLILIVTGLLLMFYYHPTVPRAYHDMKDLGFVVSAGVFLRNVHRWAAHAMVALVFLHMVRVFFAGAYQPPRQFNWVIGVGCLLITVLMSYTGYLLPWDQLALWGVTVGTKLADAVPLVGDEISFLLLGGNRVDENTLVRFYVLHVAVLPAALLMLISVHIWRVRKDGGIYIPEDERGETTVDGEEGSDGEG
jgi:quinol-cytochrome oxidoreductase complex cytochrome b subunit